jgi:threonine dehydrogenase-like Zn-dependent dehydrogenase
VFDPEKERPMKAVVYHGRYDVRVDDVPDPRIEEPRDAIVKVTSTAICGSDLHLYDGYIPAMQKGDILGHEFMGEVVEVGSGNKKLKVGDRVVVPFTICCGECYMCRKGMWSCCERSNRTAETAAKMFGHACGGLFGYSHLTGGYAGGQAQYVRVPFADVAPTLVPNGLTDEQVLFLTDIFPTGWQAAEYANIQPGDGGGVRRRPGRADDHPQRPDDGRGQGGGDRPCARASGAGRRGRGRGDRFRQGRCL